MNKNLTEIIVVLDNSGSMDVIKSDAIGGFNSFISSQKEVKGKANVTVCLFNTEKEYLVDNIDINEVPTLTATNYVPGGGTALNDTLGDLLEKVGKRIVESKPKERPRKVIFAILTDGEENSSRRYSTKQIKELIEYRKNHFEWEFVFLAANQDAFKTAELYSFDKNKTFNFDYSGEGIRSAYSSMNSTLCSLRS